MAKKKSTALRDCVGIAEGPSKKERMRYQAEDDIRTLQRAAEIKADKERMAYAKKCADEQVNALKKIK